VVIVDSYELSIIVQEGGGLQFKEYFHAKAGDNEDFQNPIAQ